jgi:UDP-N-acetylglucosamine:LPS N-acetylglucosamine transferase
MVILSGPEPQRTFLEQKIIQELDSYEGNVVFIKGVVQEKQISYTQNHITYYNFMNSEQLENTFNQSEKVLCRSGYTTVMDLAKLGKKAFFIPTPGQYEQEYLAEKYKMEGIAPCCNQEEFTIDQLLTIENYNGLENFSTEINWNYLFRLF